MAFRGLHAQPSGDSYEQSVMANETMTIYNQIISRVQHKSEETLEKCNYRKFMLSFFAQWSSRTQQIMNARINSPVSTQPTLGQGTKRSRDESEGEDEEPAAKKVKTGLDSEDEDPSKKPKKEDSDDDSLGSDLDSDDDDDEEIDFNKYCEGLKDFVVCLYDDVKKIPKKANIRAAFRNGVIMVQGMPDIVFKQMKACFDYH